MQIGEAAGLIEESRRLLSKVLKEIVSEDTSFEGFTEEQLLVRRKPYWKLLKAKRHLSNFCNSLLPQNTTNKTTLKTEKSVRTDRSMLPQSPENNFAGWLSSSKSRWDAIRARNRDGAAAGSGGDTQSDVSSFPNAEPQQWSSSSSYSARETQHHETNEVVPQFATPRSLAELIYTERMDMNGFAAIASALAYLHPNEVFLTLQGYENIDQWSSANPTANPSFSYYDNPMPGWRKDILIRMGGKTQGSLDVVFTPPEGGRRLRTKMELQSYVTRFNLSSSMVHRFDYRTVYCVCHQPESKERSYIECSFGRGGCNGWLHSQCVGLGKLGEMDLRAMETVVCPLCVTYLRAIGADEFLKNKRVLERVTVATQPSVASVNDEFDIIESSEPHATWGLEGTRFSYQSSRTTGNKDKDREGRDGGNIFRSPEDDRERLAKKARLELEQQYRSRGVPPPRLPHSFRSSNSSSSGSAAATNTSAAAGLAHALIAPPPQLAKPSNRQSSLLSTSSSSSSAFVPTFSAQPSQPTRPTVSSSTKAAVKTEPSSSSGLTATVTSTSNGNAAPRTPVLTTEIDGGPLPSIFQHRLFQGAFSVFAVPEEQQQQPPHGDDDIFSWVRHSDTDDDDDDAATASSATTVAAKKRQRGGGSNSNHSSDDDDDDADADMIEFNRNYNNDDIDPIDRIRWARFRSKDQVLQNSSSLFHQLPENRVKVRVIGGWMKKSGSSMGSRDDDSKSVAATTSSSSGDGSSGGGSGAPKLSGSDLLLPPGINVKNEAGETETSAAETKAIIVERIKRRAVEIEEFGHPQLDAKYRSDLLQLSVNRAYSTTYARKTSASGSSAAQAAAVAAASASLELSGLHAADPLEQPLIMYLPAEDGGLRAACVSSSLAPKTLQTLCATSQYCGLCFQSFPPPNRASGKNSKKKSSKSSSKKSSKQQKAPEEDEDPEPLAAVKKVVGAVEFSLHACCAFAMDSDSLLERYKKIPPPPSSVSEDSTAAVTAEANSSGRMETTTASSLEDQYSITSATTAATTADVTTADATTADATTATATANEDAAATDNADEAAATATTVVCGTADSSLGDKSSAVANQAGDEHINDDQETLQQQEQQQQKVQEEEEQGQEMSCATDAVEGGGDNNREDNDTHHDTDGKTEQQESNHTSTTSANTTSSTDSASKQQQQEEKEEQRGSSADPSSDVEDVYELDGCIRAGPIYECDEDDDAECDLCGRTGGIMQFFDLNPSYSALLPPGEEGWLAHVPCIIWLLDSRSMKRPTLQLPLNVLTAVAADIPTALTTGDYSNSSSVLADDSMTLRSNKVQEPSFEAQSNSSTVPVTVTPTVDADVETVHTDMEVVHTDMEVVPHTDMKVVHTDMEVVPHTDMKVVHTDMEVVSEVADSNGGTDSNSMSVTGTGTENEQEATTSTTTTDVNTSDDATIVMTGDVTSSSSSSSPSSSSVNAPQENAIVPDDDDDEDDGPSLHTNSLSVVVGSSASAVPSVVLANRDDYSSLESNEAKDDNGDEARGHDYASVNGSSSVGVPEVAVPVVNQGMPINNGTNDAPALPPPPPPLVSSVDPNSSENPAAGAAEELGAAVDVIHLVKKKKEEERERVTSLFDSLMGNWRCSLCGQQVGMCVRCASSFCTVRAHPLCVSIAGPSWRLLSLKPSKSSSNSNSDHRTVDDASTKDADADAAVLTFLCAIHSNSS